MIGEFLFGSCCRYFPRTIFFRVQSVGVLVLPVKSNVSQSVADSLQTSLNTVAVVVKLLFLYHACGKF